LNYEKSNTFLMRQKKRKITDKAVVKEILSQSEICRIAFNDTETPYIVPFNYGYSDNCIYIHCAPEGKKIDLIRKNNSVCFEIENKAEIIRQKEACKWETLFRSVVGYAEVETITSYEEKIRGLEIIMAHNGAEGKQEFGRQHVDKAVILKLKIKSITGKQSSNWDKIIESRLYHFETGRLALKEVSWGDLENIHKLHSEPEVDRYNTLGIPENIEATKKVIRPAIKNQMHEVRKTIMWSIFRKKDNEFIGLAGMTLSADRFKLGEIYYKLLPASWGNGYGTEAARGLIKFGFEKMGLHKIEAGVATENIRSVKVLEKAGMKREGLRRKILPIRGEWKDNYHYAIVEDDPRNN